MKAETIESWTVDYQADQDVHATPDGVDIYWERRGEGPPLVIVSSVFVVSTAWRNFTNALAQRNTVITYDLRNQGGSSLGDGSFEHHISDLGSLLDRLEVERAYVLGASLSTLIGRDFALQQPDRVKGLILCGPSFSPWGSPRRRRLVKSWLASLEAGGPEALFDAFYPMVFGDRTLAVGGTGAYLALRERFLALNSAAQLEANLTGSLKASDDPELLGGIRCPTLLLTGDDDFSCSPAVLGEIERRIPDCRTHLIPSCGHVPYFEAIDAFEAAVQAFIDEVER
jgi:3-oxoadipate enol-lactonase